MIDDNRQIFKAGESPLKTLRSRMGHLSQEDFARLMGVTASTVSRWERGAVEAQFTLKQMKTFKKLLDEAGFKWEDLPDTFGPLPE